ncbi:hypothetical protein Hanom_Chr16g01505581 [Helianthus anomalus]
MQKPINSVEPISSDRDFRPYTSKLHEISEDVICCLGILKHVTHTYEYSIFIFLFLIYSLNIESMSYIQVISNFFS